MKRLRVFGCFCFFAVILLFVGLAAVTFLVVQLAKGLYDPERYL